MWTGSTDILTNQSPRNYMFGEKVFILDEITEENCAYLIGDLSTFVFNPENQGKTLIFIINSPGGSVYTMMTIIGLINIAKLSNINVLTFTLGLAASAASMIAVQGDERFMSHISRHLIHFGCIWDMTTKHSEIEKTYIQNKEYADNLRSLYLDNSKGKMSPKILEDLQSDERGYLNAEDCLKYGLCDKVVEYDLFERNKAEAEQAEKEEEFHKYLKDKAKKEKERKLRLKEKNKKGKK